MKVGCVYRGSVALIGWLLALWPVFTHAQDASPRYAEALSSELAALGLHAECTQPSSTSFACSYPARSSLDRTDLTAHAHYDDTTDTVYLYVPLLSIAETSARLPAVLRRAMELNYELLSAKLEWNPASAELRLSAVLHTDSNFDRRAFRSLLRSLDRLSLRYSAEFMSLAADGGSKP
jgi:hypothetical protein